MVLVGKPKGNKPLEDLEEDWRMILYILKK
jgi:hypothetical protein